MSGLQNLQHFFPLVSKKSGGFELLESDKEALIVFEHVNTLLESHLMIFSERTPVLEDYYQVAKDYKSFLDRASEYFTASSQQNEILQALMMRKNQTAGIVGFGFIGAAMVATVVVYLSLKGVDDQKLTDKILFLKKAIKVCSDKNSKNRNNHHVWQQEIYNVLGHSYGEAEEIFCSQKSHFIDTYEDIFGDVNRHWGRGHLCEFIGASSKEDCDFRKWLCEELRKLKHCLQEENIQIKWLSST